jgi:hypothetical protein
MQLSLHTNHYVTIFFVKYFKLTNITKIVLVSVILKNLILKHFYYSMN